MPNIEGAGQTPWPGRSVERRHILAALKQIESVQREGATEVEPALLALNRTSVLSVSNDQNLWMSLGEGA
ncbi:hypothetical protein Y900_030160 [Mycolicibacterium aromaticivorans JS19b1 = JCM 16368]|uniref:Uncharacterized protein n=1 Tax=Mycolicibacterium aromaticivorans JS19b1 = JCM 16368 TaxID=1440774 RepID=A0A064C9A1_9MYCO|nr:hypothetical protein [Mycolicibacterium aromaticivorans]KDE96900.1 hypothetical protein Y900_030160 [Mycolicibacterium aromaticivorans JS19b1 = JCM 16368]